jgi:hypothetical protein
MRLLVIVATAAGDVGDLRSQLGDLGSCAGGVLVALARQPFGLVVG